MTLTQNRPELTRRIAFKLNRVAEYTEGSVLATRQALSECEVAQRDLGVLIASLKDRLDSIDRD